MSDARRLCGGPAVRTVALSWRQENLRENAMALRIGRRVIRLDNDNDRSCLECRHQTGWQP